MVLKIKYILCFCTVFFLWKTVLFRYTRLKQNVTVEYILHKKYEFLGY
jgi:hypothetical protein